jgi:hypothetical protein
MKLDSVRSLKTELVARGLTRYAVTRAALPRAAIRVMSAIPETPPPSPLALGITKEKKQYRLAVRVQGMFPGVNAMVERVTRRAAGEVEVRMVGRVSKQQGWVRRRTRPLRVGSSIGHLRITAGTLGCFVTRTGRDGAEDFILSNNHVLADENRGTRGDRIVQPGPRDGGKASTDTVGTLADFVKLKARNEVDAAIATIEGGLEYYPFWVTGLGVIAGLAPSPIDIGDRVAKLGRTTGLTRGRVSAIEIDDLTVEYDIGDLRFDNQIEIAPEGGSPFSLGGDSGSLVVDGRRRAVGLLFAGNDVDATYVNPIETVFDELGLRLPE